MLTGNADLSVTPKHIAPRNQDYVLIFKKDQVLTSGDDTSPSLATYEQLKPLLPKDTQLFELVCAESVIVFCPDPSQGVEVAEQNGLCYRGIRAFQRAEEPQASLMTAGFHLWNWYRKNRYCGRCGKPMGRSETERALVCEACGNIIYPMIAPAVIVAVTKGDKLLLAQNLHYVTKHHTLIAGYVEVGESLEHAVRREVMEEVGLRLGNVRYLGDQPWGVSGSMMFGFQAEAEGDDPIRLQEDELSSAAWFSRDELPMELSRGSIAYALIERFREGTL